MNEQQWSNTPEEPTPHPAPHQGPHQAPHQAPQPAGQPTPDAGAQPTWRPSGYPAPAPEQAAGWGSPSEGGPAWLDESQPAEQLPQTGAYFPQQRPGGNRPGGRKWFFIIGGGVLAFLLVIVVGGVAVVGAFGGDRPAAGDPAGSSGQNAGSATEAVQQYLDALATGDAKRAVNLLADPPPDTSLMTSKMLQASNVRAPISEITVKRTTTYGASVLASYKLGEQRVNANISVDDSSGSPKITRGYASVDLPSGPWSNQVLLNGIPVQTDRVYLLPGSYRVTPKVKHIELGDQATFLVDSPGAFASPSYRPTLSAQGQKIFKKKVADAISGCLSSTRLKAGCGLGLPLEQSGWKFKDATVKRTLPGETETAIDQLTASLDFHQPTVAEPAKLLADTVTTTVVATRDGKTERIDVYGTDLDTPTVDFADKDLNVVWSD